MKQPTRRAAAGHRRRRDADPEHAPDLLILHNVRVDDRARDVAPFARAAEARGAVVRRVRERICRVENGVLTADGEPVRPRAALLRLSNSPNADALADALVRAGTVVVHDPVEWMLSRDKSAASARLAAAGVPVLGEVFVPSNGSAPDGLDYPVVVKPRRGRCGVGVGVCRTRSDLEAALPFYTHSGAIVQRFVAEADGRDMRLFVVGDRVVAAIRRTAADGVRANLSAGGTADAVPPGRLPSGTADMAVRANLAFPGLLYSGIDLIESDDGWKVLEVNAVPGIRLEVTGVDVADAVVAAVLRRAGWRRGRVSRTPGRTVGDPPKSPEPTPAAV